VLYSEILDVATLTYSADSEIIRELYDRVNKCFNAEAPEEHSRADKKAKNTIIKMEKLMVKYPFLYEAEKYADMKNSLIILEEKTEFSRQFYNEEITSYNERVFRLPVRIVSSIFNFRKKNAL
jgi:LemA protein